MPRQTLSTPPTTLRDIPESKMLIVNAKTFRMCRAAIERIAPGLFSAMLPFIVGGASAMLFHAALLRSTPAANSHLTASPQSVRLVFSESVVPSLSRISLVDAHGNTQQLDVATDPHDARSLVGTVRTILAGRYTVAWHVLSSDGHASGGTFDFTVTSVNDTAAAIAQTNPPPPLDTPTIDSPRAATASASTSEASTPVLASILRGTGLGSLMAGLGLLFFALTATGQPSSTPLTLPPRLIAAGALLLIAHLLVWLRGVSANGSLSGPLIGAVFASTPGRLEFFRVGLALLTLCAAFLSRGRRLTIVLGVACLVVSGAVGHPAAIEPIWTIPSKAVHLLAGAAWLGGLLWLATTARNGNASFPDEARRVSAIALGSVVAILVSGILQTAMFLSTPSDVVNSTYGRLALIKIVGVLALIALGAVNRLNLVPVIDDSTKRPALLRTVRAEILLVVALILIGGFLAYTPTPASASTGSSTLQTKSVP